MGGIVSRPASDQAIKGPEYQLFEENGETKSVVFTKFQALYQTQRGDSKHNLSRLIDPKVEESASLMMPSHRQSISYSVRSLRSSLHTLRIFPHQHSSRFHNVHTSKHNNDNPVLPKDKVIELVKWVLKNSSDTQRTDAILNIFNNCLMDGLNYDEFRIMYESVTARVSLEHLFNQQFEEIDVHHKGFVEKSQILQISDKILREYARHWCTKAEIVEIKRKLSLFFENESRMMSRQELYEIFDAMLITIRVIQLAKIKLKEFDQDQNGEFDEDELESLAGWISKTCIQCGVQMLEEDRLTLHKHLMANYESKGTSLITIRDLAVLFEAILEVTL